MHAGSSRPRGRQPRAEPPRREDPGLHFGPTLAHDPLAPGLARRLIDAAITVLEDTGVAFDVDSEAPALFAAAGCDIAPDGVVRISRPATCDYLGSLDEGITYSLHSLLLCDDLAGLLRNLWQGIRIDDDSLAVSLAHSVGPRGNYLALDHTASHCREKIWQTRYFRPHIPTSMSTLPDQELRERVDLELRRILATHTVADLPAPVLTELDAIRARFAASYTAP